MFTNPNSEELLSLLRDFHRLTDMKICIYDEEGEETLFYPDRFTPFCRRLREDAESDRQCRLCDQTAIATCRRTNEAIIYVCHAGLTECIAPVLVSDVIRGFIAIGQIRESAAPRPDLSPEFRALYEDMPVLPRERILAALHVLEACAGYDKLKDHVRKTALGFASAVQDFVDRHLSEDVGVDTLMRFCRLPRVELYRAIEQTFGCTPAAFVRLRKLHRAEELLKDTDKNVQTVAAECGIGDYNYFSKVFKKHSGMSPRDYRKTARVRQ